MHKHHDQNDPVGRILHSDIDSETYCITIGNPKWIFFSYKGNVHQMRISNLTLLRMSSLANGIASRVHHFVCNQQNTSTILFKARPCTDVEFASFRSELEIKCNEVLSDVHVPTDMYNKIFPFRRDDGTGTCVWVCVSIRLYISDAIISI